MKNQYFGDFGDYQKFSLLRCLRDTGGFRITVHWMKTKDDASNDGSRIGYLEDPAVWDSFDRDIFEFLRDCMALKNRDLAHYETSHHASGIKFFNDYVNDLSKRSEMLEAIRRDKTSDLIFFDPDNGIEVTSTNPNNVHKYVLRSDIETVLGSGKSVLIYQHFIRKNRDIFIREKVQKIKRHFRVSVSVIRVRHSVYFLLGQKRHAVKIGKALKEYSNIWKALA
ncbi:MAG: hypothetical protein AAB692_00460 [Patescibacteria group bacterium]